MKNKKYKYTFDYTLNGDKKNKKSQSFTIDESERSTETEQYQHFIANKILKTIIAKDKEAKKGMKVSFELTGRIEIIQESVKTISNKILLDTNARTKHNGINRLKDLSFNKRYDGYTNLNSQRTTLFH